MLRYGGITLGIVVVLGVLALLRACLKHKRALARIEQIAANNKGYVTVMPNTDTFILGYFKNLEAYFKAQSESEEPVLLTHNFTHDVMARERGYAEFNAADHQVTLS